MLAQHQISAVQWPSGQQIFEIWMGHLPCPSTTCALVTPIFLVHTRESGADQQSIMHSLSCQADAEAISLSAACRSGGLMGQTLCQG